MKFRDIQNSVCFEFNYLNYRINVADYVTDNRDDYTMYPDGKISVMIETGGESLPVKTLEEIEEYVQKRLDLDNNPSDVPAVVVACENCLELRVPEDSEFMTHLLECLRSRIF